MVASPHADYAQKLGESTYQMAGLEWLVIEVIRRLNSSVSMETLAGMTAHGIAEKLVSEVNRAEGIDPERFAELKVAAQQFADLPQMRNDAAHARPATTPDGQQELFRWAPTKSEFIGFIDHNYLDQLLTRVREVERQLDEARSWLPLVKE